MIPFKIKSKKETISFSIPSGWSEITLGQLILLSKWDNNDVIKLLSILCKVDYGVLKNSMLLDIDTEVLPFLDWIKKPIDFEKLKAPEFIRVDNQLIKVPKDIGVKTFGQKISLQIYLEKNQAQTIIELIPVCLAIYLQPIIEGSNYDEDRAFALTNKMLDVFAVEGYPVASFFFRNFMTLSKKNSYFCILKGIARKFRRELKI